MVIDKDSMDGQLDFQMAENISSQRMAKGTSGLEADNADYPSPDGDHAFQNDMEEMLYSRHAEVASYADLATQRGTPIPAMFNQFYKYIQNPSSVSVETFKRMVDTDDTIGSGVDFLTTCLAARMGSYQHDNPDIAEWVNKRLDEIDGGWFNVVKKMLSASWAGFSISEKVWANTDNGFVPKKVVSLPPSTVLFETDRTGEITEDGILQYQRNYNPALFGTGSSYLFGFSGFSSASSATGGGGRPDGFAKLGDLPFPLRTANTYSYLSIRIPRLKVIHYSFDAQGNFENPYGRSILRRCYKWYVMKDAFLQMLAVALDRKGTPLTVVFADPNATLQDPSKATPGVNSKGKQAGIRADLAAQQAFKNVHNDTTIILPGKKGQIYDIEFIANDANVSGFVESIKLCNQSMMRAMLIPALVFMGGDGSGSYALGEAHSKTFDKILDGMLSSFSHVLINQLVYEMIAYNFPREKWQKQGLGSFGKRELSQDERDKELTALKTAWEMGAIDPQGDLNDQNKVRESVQFEPRDKLPPPPLMPGLDEGGEGGDGLFDDAGVDKGKPGVGKKPKPDSSDSDSK